MKTLFTLLGVLVGGFIYLVCFLAHILDEIKATLRKRPLMRVR